MFPTMDSVAEQFIDSLNSEIEKSNIIEIKDILARFTTDVIGSCAFGIECNSLKNPDAIFRQMGCRIFTDHNHFSFVNAMVSAAPSVARKLHVHMTPCEITEFFLNIVPEDVDYREEKHDLLMELNKGKLKFVDSADEKGLKLEQMAAQVFLSVVLRHHPLSSHFYCTSWLLIKTYNREEILEAVENDDGKVTYEGVNSIPYMKPVISVLPHLQRKAITDYVVPGHTKYVIEKDTIVYISVMGIQHDPKIYPEILRRRKCKRETP